jgi:glucan phosphoethanolaminetransferase (alkaline phosphatase superfamily)
MVGAKYTREFVIAKTADLALVSVYYFIFATIASITMNLLSQFYEKYTNDSKDVMKSLPRLSFEVFANIFFILFVFWIIRNVVEIIPFPLEGYGGYTHNRVSLPTVLLLTSITMLFFQTTLMDKIRELNTRLFAALNLSDSVVNQLMQKTL